MKCCFAMRAAIVAVGLFLLVGRAVAEGEKVGALKTVADVPLLGRVPLNGGSERYDMGAIYQVGEGFYYLQATLDNDSVVAQDDDTDYSLAGGEALFVLDTKLGKLHYQIEFSGLVGGGSPIIRLNGPAGSADSGEVIQIIELTGPSAIGVWPYAEELTDGAERFEKMLLGGKVYVDIQTDRYPLGEIRGHLEPDSDADGSPDAEEKKYLNTDIYDRDSDDDGLLDGEEIHAHGLLRGWVLKVSYLDALEEYRTMDAEDKTGEPPIYKKQYFATDPLLFDSDGDGLGDGLELGAARGYAEVMYNGNVIKGTAGNLFIPDADPLSWTHPLYMDTNSNAIDDGVEDSNRNGRIDVGESGPVCGFYEINGQPAAGTITVVYQSQRDEFDEPFIFRFGSVRGDVSIGVDPPGLFQVTPKVLHWTGEGQQVRVSRSGRLSSRFSGVGWLSSKLYLWVSSSSATGIPLFPLDPLGGVGRE